MDINLDEHQMKAARTLCEVLIYKQLIITTHSQINYCLFYNSP